MTFKPEEEKKFIVRSDPECNCIRCIILNSKLKHSGCKRTYP